MRERLFGVVVGDCDEGFLVGSFWASAGERDVLDDDRLSSNL